MRTTRTQCLMLTLLASSCGTALADEHVMLDDASVSIGLFSNNTNVDASTTGTGTPIKLDHDLGIGGTQSLPYISVSWRPWERHEFNFSYYSDDQSRTRTLQRDITFQGETYSLGATVDSKLSYTSAGLAYTYWMWIGDQGAFGLTGGIDSYNVSLRITGTATASGSGSVSTSATVKGSTDIPDPFIGIDYHYQMTDWARLKLTGGAFKANVQNVDATLYSAVAGVEFYPWKNVGLVTQYALNRIDADITKNNFDGNFKLHFQGAQVLLKLRF